MLGYIGAGEQVLEFPSGYDEIDSVELRVQAGPNHVRIERTDGQSIQLVDSDSDQEILDQASINAYRPDGSGSWIVARVEVDEQRGRYLNDFLADVAMRYQQRRFGITEHARYQSVVLV